MVYPWEEATVIKEKLQEHFQERCIEPDFVEECVVKVGYDFTQPGGQMHFKKGEALLRIACHTTAFSLEKDIKKMTWRIDFFQHGLHNGSKKIDHKTDYKNMLKILKKFLSNGHVSRDEFFAISQQG